MLYIRDDVEEGKVYFVKNKFDDKLREWVDNNLIIEGRGRAFIDRSYGKIAINVDTQDLENSIAELSAEERIEKLEEGFRKIELKNEREKKRRVYNLMSRIEELNKDTIWIVVDDPSKIVRLEDY